MSSANSGLLRVAAAATFVVGGFSTPPQLVAQAMDPTTGRIRHTINENWRFAPGDVAGAQELDFDDSLWAAIDLPHTWNAVDAFDKKPGYRRGIGWYRKTLASIDNQHARKYYVYFEGANQIADVFCDGVEAGSHTGGYTAFVVDVTNCLAPGGPHELAVRVTNEHDPDVPPLDADFTFFGGIYRDVWLLSTNEVHVDVMDHASPGIFVDTPVVSDTLASVRVRGTVVNDGAEDRTVLVRSQITDGAKLVAAFEFSLDVPSQSGEPFDITTPGIPDMSLWSPDRPYLYSVVTELLIDEQMTDRVRVPFGIRSVRISEGGGLLLNERPIRLNGTNRHQDYPGFGNAVPDWVHRKDVRIVKENGFNFLRLAHYPQDPVVLDEADRLGLVVWEEIPVVNIITMSDAFNQNSERMLVEMIRQHYNHPSILMWGYMNEVMLRKPRPEPEGYYERLLALAKRLERVVKREDPTRVTVMAQSVGEVYDGKGLSDVTDILGMNLYFGWYYDDFDSLGTFLDRVHAEHPGRPLVVSEYGAGSDERVHARNPRAFDFSSEHAQNYHLASFGIMAQRPYLVGSAVWNQFDFGSEGRQDTKNAINQKGLYFYDRSPKDIAYYYKAALLDDPVLHLADEWSHRAGSNSDASLEPVWVYSNAERVELYVNGVSMGRKPVVKSRADWSVAFDRGRNDVRAIARIGTEVVETRAEIDYDDRSSFFTTGAEPGAVLAVNAGAAYEFIGRDGVVWEADQPYETGGWGYIGGTDQLVHNRIRRTDDDPLFQTSREGADAYRFDVTDGSYEVEILLAETTRDVDRGAFSVFVNDRPVWTMIEPADAPGRYVAARRTSTVEASGGEGIVVQYEPAESSTISGILIRRME